MSCICLTINGNPFSVKTDDIPVNTSLNTFIRNHVHLKGTKSMCLEGGCGVCIVTVKRFHPLNKNLETFAVNSCLMPVYACHNVDVVTIEGLGNKKDGYAPEQFRLLAKNGSQCGYCSPGMIMNMHSLLEREEGNLTMENIENSFGGNMCRCTGYRPILDAFKSFAVDADKKLLCNDIEDLPNIFTRKKCAGACPKDFKEYLHLKFEDGSEWYKVYTLDKIVQILKDSTNVKPYMLLAGNTAHGVFRRSEDLKLFIDINDVSDLRGYSILDNELVVGANNNLTDVMKIFTLASETPGFEYCIQLAKHIDLMANVPVRNIGTIAGNLSIKHQHNRFPSDLFVILESVGAKITIIDVNNTIFTVGIAKYLTVDMTKKVIVNVKLPTIDPNLFKFRSYKIMLRGQNCEAYVNAAFLLKFDGSTVDSASMCFGGINAKFIHANDTEMIIRGKNIYTNETLQLLMKVLKNELRPDELMPYAKPEYRQKLAISLFYKFVLSTCKESLIKPEYKSGGNILGRSLSSGTQVYDTRTDEYPVTEPITKYDGIAQISGNALYTNDIPNQHNELWAAFVPATRVHYKIGKIDATEALRIPGVRFFYSAEDIPGKNSFTAISLLGIVEDEEIFVGYKSEVLFYGQPVGVILADTFSLANLAADKVKIAYVENDSYIALARTLFNPWFEEKKVLPTIQDTFNAREKYEEKTKDTNSTWEASKPIQGRMEIPGQYHINMEPQTTVCIPSEDGILVYTATQWIDFTNIVISECLKVPENSIHIVVHRLGGAYGGKITRSAQIACACALACHLTGLPIRFVMSLESNMTVIGKRNGMIGEYEVEVDGNGKIEKFSSNSAHDMGCSLNESPSILASIAYPNCYDATLWQVKSQNVKTDAPSHTWCRAPGTLESIALAETIMEHISRVIGKDPISVRLANISGDSYMKTLIPNFLKDIEFENRKKKVDDFNKKNRWNKRGIAVVPMKYPILYFNTNAAYVCVYHYDGTTIISHGGIEMGQGINTKIAQIAAYTLGIPYTFIKVTPTNNVVGGNCMVTGGSMTSEMICFAVKKACEEILGRLKPIREENKNASWVDITKAAYNKHIDLSAKYTAKAEDLKAYDVWGLTCAEIETDVLTGNIQLLRVDILEDAGESMNPLNDIGQIEGAFIMGVGYWLTENLIYDRINGELLTNRTWNYRPPGAKDIPIDFRIKLLQNSPNTVNVLRSKAVGEPAITMSIVVTFALRYALESARSDAGFKDPRWFRLPTPATPEVIALNAGHSSDSFSI